VQDHEGDDEPDHRIGDGNAEGHDRCTCDHAEAHEAVNASLVAIRNKSRAVQALPGPRADRSRDLVPDETDHSGRR
jgi:hypothetical protein